MKKYLLKQLVIIVILFVLSFMIHIYMKKTNSLLSVENIVSKQTIILIILSVILLIYNLLLYNFANINSNFMKHRIWRKMHILILVWLIISFLIFVILFSTTSFIQNHLWTIYIIIYYFLFFINLLVLSIVNNLISKNIVIKKKLTLTWIISTLIIILT